MSDKIDIKPLEEGNMLLLAEKFFSPQCEGITTGVPAYFIRVAGCNLACGVSKQNVRALKRSDPKDWTLEEVGDLTKEGKATWTCDSILEWIKGQPTSFADIVDDWAKEGILERVRNQNVHLIFTGGEPTVLRNQKRYIQFLDYLRDEHNIVPYTEVETNGTQYLIDEFFDRVDQINCSPKLGNSGMEAHRRIVDRAILRIKEHPNHWFKFVVSSRDDVVEYQNEYVIPFDLNPKQVGMMPAESNTDHFHENTRMVMEFAKEFGYRGWQRMHISAWNQTTGV